MVVAVEIEVAGELLAARTTFFSCKPVSSQRSTWRTKKVGSTELRWRHQHDSFPDKVTVEEASHDRG